MNVHKRFIFHFFLQLFIVISILFILLLSLFGVLGYSLMKEELKKDLTEAENSFFSDKVTIENNKVTFSGELRQLAKKNKGWFQVIAKDGEVIGAYNTTADTPVEYKPGGWISLTLLGDSSPIKYTYWELEEASRSYYLLYGRENTSAVLMQEVIKEVDWSEGKLNLSEKTEQLFDQDIGLVQLLNEAGQEVDAYGKHDKQSSVYKIEELLEVTVEKKQTSAYFDEETEQTVLISLAENETEWSNYVRYSLWGIGGLSFMLLVVGAVSYVRKFGIPLIQMMGWIQSLGHGLYEEPLDRYNRPIIKKRNGKLKYKYRLYKDLITSLTYLTNTLRENDIKRLQMENTREEWIAGISHDLKTPLSSIYGYAQMLEAENYKWSEEETRQFGSIIAEKSVYMMDLLEDLTLTYRLKNGALRIDKDLVDLNEQVRKSVISFINDQANQSIQFIFEPAKSAIFTKVASIWFQRIIDNLIANAIKYNPPDVTITVSIAPIEQHLVVITIEDDGRGMDQETLDKLFQRYYRGSNTSDIGSGTGLGMAITKQLVLLHGGTINVKSERNKGTIIRMIFPIHTEDNGVL